MAAYDSFVGSASGTTVVNNEVIDPSLTSATARQKQFKLPSVVVAVANNYLAVGSKLDVSGLG